MDNHKELFVKMVLDAWNVRRKSFIHTLMLLTNGQLENQISPGRNTGVYLLGHMTAIHDAMIPLLFGGQKLHPELEEPFVNSPDNTNLPRPEVNLLREYWNEVNLVLVNKFAMTKPDEWFERDYSVSEDDFEREPHRNRLNIVIHRTNHLAHHLGQLLLLTSK